VIGETLTVGPDREGPAAACGGPLPTPTDALVVAGKSAIGSRDRAVAALAPLAARLGTEVDEVARRILAQTCAAIAQAVRAFITEINSRPVYTIHELLEDRRFAPRRLCIIGGPAHSLAEPLGNLLESVPAVPEHAEVANAIGAALARTTTELTLLADTDRRRLTIAEEGVQMTIPAHFTRGDVIRVGRQRLKAKAMEWGAAESEAEIEVVEAQEFNMVRGFSTSGKNIRVKVQIKPGFIAPFGQERT
jgi:hypothetical protein